MSKPIKMTQKYMDECRADFEKALQLTKLADGKLSFTKTFTLGTRKATVHFTSLAWSKMVSLLREFDKEVAWHGVASRGGDESKDEYTIEDIVVYPQEVTGATVEMDTEKYALWLMENAEDERFNNIHMQGHSHVNMATSPSSVDLTHQEEILNMLGDDDFYIFMIWNKRHESNTKIYDMRKNILFENADVTITHENGEMEAFINEAKGMVKTKTYTPPGGYGYSYNRPAGAPYNPLATTKPDDKKESAKDDKAKGGKKEKPRTKIGAGWAGINASEQGSLFDDEYDDEYGYGLYEQYSGRR